MVLHIFNHGCFTVFCSDDDLIKNLCVGDHVFFLFMFDPFGIGSFQVSPPTMDCIHGYARLIPSGSGVSICLILPWIASLVIFPKVESFNQALKININTFTSVFSRF